ncbi:hypothetical protein [Pseudomonas sp. SXM-1]|uniref:hypothetical protein n=1 Tax=Pseudomonas sp. SXM-1 TaxID=2169583 RepID=UPI001067E522|nr:hypothetical protein [Pseudomonas sp. SXM-1]QBQ11062.1 hypothetical protein DCC84_15585 [Pseudomonas sp. SXM-1]
MELKEISNLQIALDEKHGFPVKFSDEKTRYDQITKDLVGLFGEIGEFSNLVKKINLKMEHTENYKLDMKKTESALKEELIDSLIYIIRIGAILDIDIEHELLKKIAKNQVRYASLTPKP